MRNKKIKIVTTSWDDGHKLDLKLAKLLRKYNIKGTFYIAPNIRKLNKKDFLSNNEIKQLSQDFEIGAHTMTHTSLTKISEREALQEIRDSKNFLEKLIEKQVKMFCYPRGLYNIKIKNLLKKVDFIGARTIRRSIVSFPVDFFEFGTTVQVFTNRINISEDLPIKINLAILPTLFTKDWLRIAKKIFDHVSQNEGIWHLWGHSWEVEKNDFWEELEETLSYISEKEDFHYFSNGETLEYIKEKYLKDKT